MLKFINDNDFLLVDKYKQNDDGSISWIYKDGNAAHSGFLVEGFTREIQVDDGTESVLVGIKKIKIGQESALVGTEPLFDSDGNEVLDENGEPQQQDVYEDVDIFGDEDVYEEQPKYKTETVDIWAKFQELVNDGTLTVEVPSDEDLSKRAYDEAVSLRQSAYRIEADPLYLEAQYDGTEESMQKWRDKVAEIKLRIKLQE